jgi:hypothetical protein
MEDRRGIYALASSMAPLPVPDLQAVRGEVHHHPLKTKALLPLSTMKVLLLHPHLLLPVASFQMYHI